MTCGEVLSRLEALGNEKLRKLNAKNGAGENQFGVKMGDIRTLAKEIKQDDALAKELWETGNLEGMLLATLVLNPKNLTDVELEAMVRDLTCAQLADWFNSYVVKQHRNKEQLRLKWMNSEHPMGARSGWSLTAERIDKNPSGLDIPALLDRIEMEMAGAPPESQWTMNFCLAGIGINFPEHRERALAIGEKLGVYRDYPVSKGCTSPFAPIWINEIVGRKKG